MREQTRQTVAVAFLCFILGLAIAGFVGALALADMKTQRDEARAACVN